MPSSPVSSSGPLVVGLTGSVAMGKSETAAMFRRLGVSVYDADAAVHALYEPGGAAVESVAAAFPGVVGKDGGIDRDALSQAVLGDGAQVARLEAIVHPLVGQAQRDFLHSVTMRGEPVVVMDIPLLFETGSNDRVDVTVVVSAPSAVQRERALERDGMTADKLEAILARQTPDEEKRARADYIIDTGKGLDHAFAQVEEIVQRLRVQAVGRCNREGEHREGEQ